MDSKKKIGIAGIAIAIFMALMALGLLFFTVIVPTNTKGFLPHKLYPVGKGADGVEIDDINFDGLNELIVANAVTSDIYIFKQTGNFSDPLTLDLIYPVAWPPSIVATGDINRDSLKDVAVAHYENYVGAGKTNKFGVLYQNRTTHLLDTEIIHELPEGLSSRAIAVGDVNSDGNDEVVVANEDIGDKVYVWGWNSDTSKLEIIGIYGNITGFVVSIKIDDVSGDGRNDVVLYGTNMFVLIQNASGELSSPIDYGPTSGESADTGDVNNDGLKDVVGATAWSGEIEVWLQSSSHILVSSKKINIGGYTEGVKIADFNNDGLKDVAVANLNSSELYIFYQNGSTEDLDLPVKYQGLPDKWLNELATGDIDGDSLIDIAGSNWGEAGTDNPQWTWVSVWQHKQ